MSSEGSTGSTHSWASSGGSPGSTPSSAAEDRMVVLSDLLEQIHGHYRAALDRFSAEGIPALIPRLLDSGVCFGLLDPVSNIIANTVSSFNPSAPVQGKEDLDNMSILWRKRKRKAATTEEQQDVEVAEEEETRRMRDEAMSEVTTDASRISFLPPMLIGAGMLARRTVAQRSLEGLVTFLICYFRNLPVSEALQYLLMAKADLLAAVYLIERTRPMGSRLCPTSSPAMEIALRCAALTASHPEPAVFAARSLLLASRFDHLSQILDIGGCLSTDAINGLHKLLDQPHEQLVDSPQPAHHAILRLNGYIKGICSLNKCPFASTETLRILILEKIHLLYLKAIAQLPKDALRRRLHRSLLKAGLCFGPSDNPVSNIILNTIWYDATFPQNEELKVYAISTNSLVRVGCRSLSGILAFLCSLFPALTEHDVMLRLFCANSDLQEVIFRAMLEHDNSVSYEDAYRAAAEAAWHPHPEALAEFMMLTSPTLLSTLESSQEVGRALTSSEVELISRYFLKKSVPVKPMASALELVPTADEIIKKNQENFIANQYFIHRKVKTALQRYAIEKGTEYELHVICGTNFKVPENGKHGYYNNHNGFPYIHVNFLAIPKGSQPDSTAPKLFFLECSSSEDPQDIPSSFCTVLGFPTDSGRCFHCEYQGNGIVHPAFGTYRGRETDFEELACGERSVGMEGLTISYKQNIDFVGFLCEADSVYFDPAVDADFAQAMNDMVNNEEEAREFERRAIEDDRLRTEALEDDSTDMEEEETSVDDYTLPEGEDAQGDETREALEVDCRKAMEDEAHGGRGEAPAI